MTLSEASRSAKLWKYARWAVAAADRFNARPEVTYCCLCGGNLYKGQGEPWSHLYGCAVEGLRSLLSGGDAE